MLRTHVETRHFSLRRSEIESLKDRVRPLTFATGGFAFADFHITMAFLLPGEEYHVKCRLCLPGRLLLSGEHDSVLLTPYDHCVHKLTKKAELESARRRGRRPSATEPLAGSAGGRPRPGAERHGEIAWVRLARAVGNDDAATFMEELSEFEALIRKRVRHWVHENVGNENVPGDRRVVKDLVEEVVLTAFERYETRPPSMRLEDWIEILIDPTLRSLLERADEPNKPEGYARSLREMSAGWPGSVSVN